MTQPTPTNPGQPLSDAAFDRLSLCYSMGDISPAEFDALCAALDGDPARREAFVGLALQMETLRQAFAAQREETASLEDESAESADILNEIIQNAVLARQRQEIEHQAELALELDAARRRSEMHTSEADKQAHTGPRVLVIPKPVVWGAIAAMMLLAAFIAVQFSGQTDHPADRPTANAPAPETAAVKPASVGQITDSIDAVWGPGGLAPDAEGVLVAGRYSLESGAVELTLGRGAEVIVQAPCSFELVEDNLARVERGRLVAAVPESATGFTIEAGEVRLVDLGTEFGVAVDGQGEITAAVFDGEVVVGSRLEHVPSVSIKGGQAVVAQASGTVGPAQPMKSLLRPIAFARSLDEASMTLDQRYADAVLADRPVLYWRFDDGIVGLTVESLAGNINSRGLAEGTVRGGAGVFGSGVRFLGETGDIGSLDSVGSVLSGEEHGYTIELWIKADRVHHGRVASLRVVEDAFTNKHLSLLETLGDAQWLESWTLPGHQPTAGSLRMFHRSKSEAESDAGQNLLTTATYPVGEWALITAVKSEGFIALYLNGEKIAEAQDHTGPSGLAGLRLGNLVGTSAGQVEKIRAFAGHMDEVAVYPYALEPERIELRYRLGAEALRQTQHHVAPEVSSRF